MQGWVDIEDAVGNKLGAGPLTTVTSWEYTWRLNQAGPWTFCLPALDPQCDLIRLGRVARAWTVRDGQLLALGGGRIEERKLNPTASRPTLLQVSGDDLLRELATRTVGNLALNQIVVSHPAYSHWINTDFWGDPTPIPLLNVNDGQIGDTLTYDNIMLDSAKFFWYIFDPAPFDHLRVVLGAATNSFYSPLELAYWNGSAWLAINGVSDGTALVEGTPFAQSGDITWTRPNDWAPMTDGCLYGLRITALETLPVDVCDVAIVRTQPCTDALAKVMGLVAGEWQLDAVLGYTSLMAATERGSDVLTNGDFETFTGTADDGVSDTFAGWTNYGVDDGSGNLIEATLLTYAGGSRAVKVTRTTAALHLYQDITVTEGAWYRMIWWSRGDGTNAGRCRVEDISHTGAAVPQYLTALVEGSAGTGWTEMTLEFTVPRGCTAVRVALHSSRNAGTVSFDLVSVAPVVGRAIDMQCAGESILEILGRVAEETGESFTLSPGGGRQVLWLRKDWRDSGLRAITLNGGLLAGAPMAEMALIATLSETQSRYELATRVYPKNQSLLMATATPPAGWTLDRVQNCLIYDTAEAALGRIDKLLDVAVLATGDSATDQYLGNMVFGQCCDWLARHTATDTHPLTGNVPRAYTLKLTNCYRWVVPGYLVRVNYDEWRNGYHAVAIDAQLYVLSAAVRVDANGLQTVALTVGSAPEQPVSSDAALLAQELRASRAARAKWR